jgi:Homeodomain-like domain
MHGVAGRHRILTRNLAEELALKVADGRTVEQASRELGVSARSVHRWQAEGLRELDRLSPEAHLALELSRARDRGQPEPPWQVTAGTLDALMAEFAGERLLWSGAGQ